MAIGGRFPQVLSAAAEGADWAWGELYRELAPGVLRFLAAHGAADPEDCLGEVFLQLVRQLPKFTGDEAAFRTWAFTIARSRLIDSWRREQRRPGRSSEDVTAAADKLRPEGATDSPSEQQAAVAEILAGLSPDQRAVLLLRYVHQFSIEETAQIVAKSEGAVRVLQHRALRSLRRTLGTQHPGQPAPWAPQSAAV
ncbi:RNA polymerase sigma-70 factor (ECF subfamily) [Propionicimonas paludicola]|uniref:RNA polymerase sigma-70 factor (ECF subfamily) n=1 Tax=Propionicimonas paludicola TaxID=185243 RepID=A0A2A9CU12_9ACTN|nr:sigma-70 family RNA polymerase sigma factor [Propionicimonas paludicola]PFG17933.1 RNA polymerase sigma-70 factor (ECF subfamily) [Propionicimonas paludicola]